MTDQEFLDEIAGRLAIAILVNESRISTTPYERYRLFTLARGYRPGYINHITLFLYVDDAIRLLGNARHRLDAQLASLELRTPGA